MKTTRLMWDMPITINIVDDKTSVALNEEVYKYFDYIDTVFSTYRSDSEISKINNGLIKEDFYSEDMKTVLKLCEQTKNETNGYFDIRYGKKIDPLGLVKGWAINNAMEKLKKKGIENFYIEAGGDIELSGKNEKGEDWAVGIRNPFYRNEHIKVLHISNGGIATSGTYIRGDHIHNPVSANIPNTLVSFTVVGPNVYEADRFATAAFAMGEEGIRFISTLKNLEGYSINTQGIATYTPGFIEYVKS